MTFYSEIFDSFLLKISDSDLLANLSDEEITTLCNKYLKIAIANFSNCKVDLSARNDYAQMFDIKLNDMEINILSSLMVLEWIRPYVTNRINLSSFLADKDYKTYSQANHLKVLIDLKNNISDEVERNMIDYTWKCFDISSLGDNI